MTPYPTTSDQKTTAKQTGGAIHKPEAPPSHSRQEQVTSIKDGRTPNPCSPEPRQRGDGCQPKPWTWKHTAISIRTVRHGRRRARHPRRTDETGTRSDRHQPSPPHHPALPHPYAVNDNAIHEPGWRRHPSNQAGTMTWPGSRRPSSFSLPIGSLAQHATAHAGASTVHATPAGPRASH